MKKYFYIICLAFLTGCATQQDVQSIQNQLTPVQNSQANTYADVQTIDQRLSTLQGKMDELNQGLGGNTANLGSRISALEEAVTMLSARFKIPYRAPNANSNTESNVDNNQNYQQSESRAEPEKQNTAQESYDSAKQSFLNGDHKQAEKEFASFIKNYPRSSLLPSAIFWKGESQFQNKDYSNAIVSYQTIIEKYKSLPVYKSALLKQGLSFRLNNQKEAGNIILKKVIKEFPNTSESTRAKNALKS